MQNRALSENELAVEAYFLERVGSWRAVVDSARTTVAKEPSNKEPSSDWKYRMLLAEHSPIRQIQVRVILTNLKSWVSVHLVRHKFGIEHYVRTQRSDRTGVPRDDLPQGALVSHEILANAQALISISRKRLCTQASAETREAWKNVIGSISIAEPELAKACVPDCIYRGWCYELKSCRYHEGAVYMQNLRQYRRDSKGVINGYGGAQ